MKGNKSVAAFGILSRNLDNYTTNRDLDGDGVPNVRDCSPLNPNRQDFIGGVKKVGKAVGKGTKKTLLAIGGTALGVHEKYKTYKAKAPERREAQIKRLEQEETILKQKVKITEHKAKISKLRQQAGGGGLMGYMQGVASASGSRKAGFSPMAGLGYYGLGQEPPKVGYKSKKHRKHKKKAKYKRYRKSKPKYALIGGKAYRLA